MKRDDFVEVRLTAKGEEVSRGPEASSGQGCLRICGGKYEFCFTPGESQPVTRGEWTEILSREKLEGEPLFEVVEKEEEKTSF